MGANSFYAKHLKGTIDFCLALVGILLFWWVFVLCAIAVKVSDPSGPVIFKQERVGQNGKVYWMYKFRSMKVNSEHFGMGVYSNASDSRVTPVGKILRASSLDEIPQLFNVLKGDIALVGYRSPLTYFPWPWDEYTEEQKKMFVMKPGITGWAQVHGRKKVEWNDRIAMNVWYAENVSLLLDIKILFMTVFKVLANADNESVGETNKNHKSK